MATNFTANLTALQLHVAFWDMNNDSIITPSEIYTGFRALGFSILFSLGGLLIPLFFSYPTTLGHSWLPDPLFRIFVNDIHKAKHGSDSGTYDFGGGVREGMFGELFDVSNGISTAGPSGEGNDTGREEKGCSHEQRSLGVTDLIRLHGRNRVAADPAGWSFAAMEWWTTWLLLQKEGRVWEDDLRGLYDGSLFHRIREEREQEGVWRQGYGWRDWVRGMWRYGEWDRAGMGLVGNGSVGEL